MAKDSTSVPDDTGFLKAEVLRLRRELNRLTPPLETLLRRRGFRVYKKDPGADLLLPASGTVDEYYTLLLKYSFRLFLRDVIRQQEFFTPDLLSRYATPAVARSYIDRLTGFGLAERFADGHRLARRPVLSFGPTLEWFIAELLKREFGADTLWGAKFRRPKVGGDYDVLAKIDGALLYVEVKSSPPKQITDREIEAFLDRAGDLSPEIAVFLVDTELRMKDKLVPMFEQALAARLQQPPPVERIERELFGVRDRLFIVNAKESIARNIGTVVSRSLQWRERDLLPLLGGHRRRHGQ